MCIVTCHPFAPNSLILGSACRIVIDQMVRELRRTLVGPRGGPRERLPVGDDPRYAYLAGVLFPTGVPKEAQENPTLLPEGEEPKEEEQVGGALNHQRGSIGITCRVSGTRNVKVVVEYGTYAPDSRTNRFVRTPHSATFSIPLDGRDGKEKLHESRSFELSYSSKETRDASALSVFVVNGEAATKPLTQDCMFQPSIRLESEDGSDAFVDRGSLHTTPGSESEMLEMLFRGRGSLAVGHGCAVKWGDGSASPYLESSLVPDHTVQDVRPAGPDLDCMSMKKMYEAGFGEYTQLLRPLADAYEEWTDVLEAKAAGVDARHARAARARVADCRVALHRIRRGIDIVSSDEAAAKAFDFVNRAMHMYQKRVLKVAEPKWRPFQLAFLLMNAESMTDPNSEDRRTADLLWFPTGGGKTEAYMGLIVFAIALRRIKNKPDYMRNGTVAIMRYTLRLLTLQQFQRAAGLMCACEFVRMHDEEKWGDEPFYVGLWVGAKVTPNSLDEAKEHLKQNKAGGPVQLLSCPWCGKPLGPRDYRISRYRKDGKPEMCRAYCPNAKCCFHENRTPTGLPVLTVDEDIYRQCPPLIIGTVDKFARMAWKPDVASIFGRVDMYCQKHGFARYSEDQHNHSDAKSFRFEGNGPAHLDPPDLLVQDELHLISGPLGTMVAMYEAVVDQMCATKVPPKIVASTATAAGAASQMRAVFGRKNASVFPPQGLEFGDTFFSEPTETGRTHVGVCADARPMSALAAVSGSIMATARRPSGPGPYRTLVSYFNSLRELGAASQVYEDTVPAEIMRQARMQDAGLGRGGMLEKRELTSRVEPSSIADILRELEDGAADVLLCTNMFSVGVDVPSLGLMVVNGQPKNHSEYIQACGRIGRKSPGLVVTVYRQMRPRDLSHYENFLYYHSALHRNVEPPVVTPFSSRARDRALFGMLVALVRLQERRLAENGRAGMLGNLPDAERLISEARSYLAARAATAGEADGTAGHFDRLVERWRELAAEHQTLAYAKNQHRPSDPTGLMRRPGAPSRDGFLEVPIALRAVEEEIEMAYVGVDGRV